MTEPWTERGSVPVPSGSLAYAARGEGQPVVLLHKVGGWIADWNAFAATFPSGFRFIALDLTGHGDSRNQPPATWDFPLENGVADILAALDALRIDRASFVGNSLGGNSAMLIAAYEPWRVNKLVLISVEMSGGLGLAEAEQADRRNDGQFDEHDRPKIRPFDDVARFYAERRTDINDELNRSRAQAGAWVRWCGRGVSRFPTPGLMPRIAAPTAVLFGEQDPYLNEFGAMACAMIPDCRILTVANASRFPHQEQPEETARTIATFLAGEPSAAATNGTESTPDERNA